MTIRFTQKDAKRYLQTHNMTFRKIVESGEYRVAFAEDGLDSERCAYYTDDISEAVATAVEMRKQRGDSK